MTSIVRYKLIRAGLGPVAALVFGVAAAASDMPSGPFDTTVDHQQAVYGDAMPDIVRNYLRATPYIGTGGSIDPEGIGDLAALGFKTVISLTTAQEGAEAEGARVDKAGMTYVNIAVSTRAPTDAQVTEFARIVEAPATYPVLVHCESANRVGAMWALYRASTGVPAQIAIEEGRTIGLKPSREVAVRERLGLPPL